jgi:hypothetical protein
MITGVASQPRRSVTEVIRTTRPRLDFALPVEAGVFRYPQRVDLRMGRGVRTQIIV